MAEPTPADTTPAPITIMRLSPEAARRFQARWDEIQAGFVTDPRGALASADDLVRDNVDALAQSVAEERNALRGRWDPADTPTESLRTSLHGYRNLFLGLLE